MKDGFLLIDKECDYTSRDVCNIIAKIFDAKKVGHAGTLDPFATGLLIVALNNATKALSYIEGQYKTYEATLLLGSKTSSGDLTGEVIETKEVPDIKKEQVIDVFQSLIGESEQTVPITSAVHVNGRKLYHYAHLNQEVELPKRTIDIKTLELLEFNLPVMKFKATVSKGTYVRTLGETIADVESPDTEEVETEAVEAVSEEEQTEAEEVSESETEMETETEAVETETEQVEYLVGEKVYENDEVYVTVNVSEENEIPADAATVQQAQSAASQPAPTTTVTEH